MEGLIQGTRKKTPRHYNIGLMLEPPKEAHYNALVSKYKISNHVIIAMEGDML